MKETLYTEAECQAEMKKLLDTKDKKSLGYLLVYLHERWEEEKTYETFEEYVTFTKNVLRKHTPKRTKFVSLTAEPIQLTIKLQGFAKNIVISVKGGNLSWLPVE